MQKSAKKKTLQPPQHQERQPGIESKMAPRPHYQGKSKTTMGRLEGRKALITGGDSGIGGAVALAFANEGEDVCIADLDEDGAAEEKRAATGGRESVVCATGE